MDEGEACVLRVELGEADTCILLLLVEHREEGDVVLVRAVLAEGGKGTLLASARRADVRGDGEHMAEDDDVTMWLGCTGHLATGLGALVAG